MRPGYYGYEGNAPLGTERLGTFGKFLRFDLKTDKGAIRALRRAITGDYRLYRFTNFYDEKTYTEVFL